MIFPQFPAPPVFLVEPEDKVTKLGSKLTLDCRLAKSGAPALQFWLRDGQTTPLLPGTGGRLAVSSQGSLSIGRITERDAGWYGCFGVSTTGSSGSMAWVGMKEGGVQPPPIIQLGPVNQTLAAGGQAELHCQTSAGSREPAQVVTWLKEGLPLEFPATERFFLGGGNNLHIRGEKCDHNIALIFLFRFTASRLWVIHLSGSHPKRANLCICILSG